MNLHTGFIDYYFFYDQENYGMSLIKLNSLLVT